MLEIELPIVAAGAGTVASARLAAAVTNAGGFGMTGSAGDGPDEVVERVRVIRSLTRGPVGVNVILALQPLENVEAILAAGIDVLASGFGDADRVVELAHAHGARVFHRCETPDEAAAAAAAGVDAVIAQGSDSGGHTGIVPTFALVPQVVDAAGETPVLAAGGIADGRGIVAALALGAEGALLGTRFVASVESGAHDHYKESIVAAAPTDSLLTDIFEIGWPGLPERVLRNADHRGVGARARAAGAAVRPAGGDHRPPAAAGRRPGDPALVRRRAERRRRGRRRRDGDVRRACGRPGSRGAAGRRDRPASRRRGRGGVAGPRRTPRLTGW